MAALTPSTQMVFLGHEVLREEMDEAVVEHLRSHRLTSVLIRPSLALLAVLLRCWPV